MSGVGELEERIILMKEERALLVRATTVERN